MAASAIRDALLAIDVRWLFMCVGGEPPEGVDAINPAAGVCERCFYLESEWLTSVVALRTAAGRPTVPRFAVARVEVRPGIEPAPW